MESAGSAPALLVWGAPVASMFLVAAVAVLVTRWRRAAIAALRQEQDEVVVPDPSGDR
ncbi:hypothetical protein [Streptomyces sp. NPDC048560]|uniref:hypothetical protein n=1 Tax=Streptomyces sp. NPDC048560 TaxID=3155488 RepID=UPI003436C1F0